MIIVTRLMAVMMGLFCFSVSAQETFLGHLSFKNDSLLIQYQFSSSPVAGKKLTMALQTIDAKTNQSIDINDNIKVVLWMPSMGHGSSPTQVEHAVDANGSAITGAYSVKNVYFVMPGEWEVRVILTDAQGTQETKSFNIAL